MAILTRRNLLKASAVAGVYAAGLGLAGRFNRAEAAPEPLLLKTTKTQANITGTEMTKEVMTYGEDGMPA